MFQCSAISVSIITCPCEYFNRRSVENERVKNDFIELTCANTLTHTHPLDDSPIGLGARLNYFMQKSAISRNAINYFYRDRYIPRYYVLIRLTQASVAHGTHTMYTHLYACNIRLLCTYIYTFCLEMMRLIEMLRVFINLYKHFFFFF